MNKTIALILGLLVLLGLALVAMQATDVRVVNNMATTTPQEDTTPATTTPSLNLTYVTTVDWPPVARLDASAYSCTEAGTPTDRTGETRKVTLDGKEWCRTVVTEGAAGSVFHQYAYTTAEQNQTLAVTFSVRMPQCANYDEPQQTACETEQEAFDPDSVVRELY